MTDRMTDRPKPPPISLRRRSGSPATQQDGDATACSQETTRPSPSPSTAGAVKLARRAGRPSQPPSSQPPPSQQSKTHPQSHTAKPGWRIVYRKDPANLPKMGTGSKPPVWIAGEEWGCPFRIEDIFVPGNPPKTETGEIVYVLAGSTAQWTGEGLGIGRPEPTADIFHPATYFDRRKAARAAQRAFRDWIGHPDQADVRQRVREGLQGRRLACLCGRKSPCHGEVLIRVANEPEEMP